MVRFIDIFIHSHMQLRVCIYAVTFVYCDIPCVMNVLSACYILFTVLTVSVMVSFSRNPALDRVFQT